MTLDDVLAAELQDRTQAMNMLLERSEYREKLALDSAVALRNENEQLLSLLAEYDKKSDAPEVPISTNEATMRMERDKAVFDSAGILPTFKEQSSEQDKKDERAYRSIRSMVVR